MTTTDLEKDLVPMSFDFGDNRAESGERNSDDLIHYQGELGDFWFDPMEFKVCQTSTVPTEVEYLAREEKHDYLRYVGKGSQVGLPKGCISTRHMFRGSALPEGFKLGEHTEEVDAGKGFLVNCHVETPSKQN